jgi:hypothetical protein
VLSEAYGGEAMKKSNDSEWYKRFKENSQLEITNEGNTQHFNDIKGTVHFELFLQGRTVNQAHYVEILKRLYKAMHRKISGLLSHNWMLQLTRRCLSISGQKLDSELEQPPCSPNLAPNDFRLLPKIKSVLKRRRFQDIENIKKK